MSVCQPLLTKIQPEVCLTVHTQYRDHSSFVYNTGLTVQMYFAENIELNTI